MSLSTPWVLPGILAEDSIYVGSRSLFSHFQLKQPQISAHCTCVVIIGEFLGAEPKPIAVGGMTS